MLSRIGIIAAALVLGGAAIGVAQTIQSGTVVRIDPQWSVVTLDDGRMYRVMPNTVLIVENRPAPLTMLRTGQRVTIQSGEVVTFRDGQYIAAAPAPTVVAPAPGVVVQTPPPVVAQAPPPPVTAVPAGVRQTIYGTVSDVDSNGEVKIKTQRDSFEIRVGPEALRQVKKGDNVVIEMMITPPGVPAASPVTR